MTITLPAALRRFVDWLLRRWRPDVAEIGAAPASEVQPALVAAATSTPNSIEPAAPQPEKATAAIKKPRKRRSSKEVSATDDEGPSLDKVLADSRRLFEIIEDRKCALPGKEAARYRVSREDLMGVLIDGVYQLGIDLDNDRWLSMREVETAKRVDVSVGLPSFIALANSHAEPVPGMIDTIHLVKQLDHLPPGYFPTGPGYPFEIFMLGNFRKKYREFKPGNCGFSSFITIDADGNIHRTAYWHRTHTGVVSRHRQPGTSRIVRIPHMVRCTDTVYDDPGCPLGLEGTVSLLFRCWASMNSRWNVSFRSEAGNIIYSVADPSTLKQLFAKEARVNRTGRIIHWVMAHSRTGTRPVRTHVRGEREFSVAEFNVQIDLPGKHKPLSMYRSRIDTIPEYGTSDPVQYRFAGSKMLALLSRSEMRRRLDEERKRLDAIDAGADLVSDAPSEFAIVRYGDDLKPIDEPLQDMTALRFVPSAKARPEKARAS